jgi:hypothetical protein
MPCRRVLKVSAPEMNLRPGWRRIHACLDITAGACADPANPRKLISDGPPAKVR